MNILLISQCQKRALTETRRILDQFGERKGERTWQTPITQIGLDTLRKMLRKTARKNTAVSCHWIRSANLTELLWIVGDAKQFNAEGSVPTNLTERNILRVSDENDWHSLTLIRMAAEMAALWHDFGKASVLFQNKLAGNAKVADPYRHEWVSLRLFQAFVGSDSDAEWLVRLKNIAAENDIWQQRLICDGLLPNNDKPFAKLPPFAHLVGWLVLSHHRLPLPNLKKIGEEVFSAIWTELDASWAHSNDGEMANAKDCWTFKGGLPTQSRTWKLRVSKLATEIMVNPKALAPASVGNPFIAHLSRLALIASDHQFSCEEGKREYGDATYQIFANTRAEDGKLKQRLDEHLVGVARYAKSIASTFSTLDGAFPSIAQRKKFKQRSAGDFAWQNEAFELAQSLQKRSKQRGFFGVNMASTGCGKTLANARIMYGLAPQSGARFCVALGLRTLTLQTGDAYRERLNLLDDDIAVMIGSSAVRALHEHAKREQREREQPAVLGSESAEALIEGGIDVRYEGALGTGKLSEFLKRDPRVLRMLSAPVLVCTVDHLMPASETLRGGHQIGPMLRLLTSDLVLDEPDDFDLEDLPALTRLVYFAGLLGSRVLLSSATLPPALVQGLFAAYLAGRAVFQGNVGAPNRALNVCCAWFDEFGKAQSDCPNEGVFRSAHQAFVDVRLRNLGGKTSEQRRKARIQTLAIDQTLKKPAIEKAFAKELPPIYQALHLQHHSVDPSTKKRVSFGLIRMANINPIIAVARALFGIAPPANAKIHLCVYHSRFPLIVRSGIEARLDQMLKRHDEFAVFKDAALRAILDDGAETDHIFLVLASPVAEVGRDHDYDWAIVEPSSMRSIIQIAGRVRRHRPGAVQHANIVLLNQNLRSLIDLGKPAFKWPGFESDKVFGKVGETEKRYLLRSHELKKLLLPADIEPLSAAPRIVERSDKPRERLLDLEHARLRSLLVEERAGEYFVRRFWAGASQFTGIEQEAKEFRDSEPQIEMYVWVDEGEVRHFRIEHKTVDSEPGQFKKIELVVAERVEVWAVPDCADALAEIPNADTSDPQLLARRFAVFQIGKHLEGKTIGWHPWLGYSDSVD
jgi:CRISPR-associated endonuclease/helicase Cas3